ncbi:hypothetical protein, partial [Prevotellamassilia timonensis]
HDRLCPLAGKSAGLPGRSRAGKFARYALADVQMCKCAGMQISRRRGTRGMLLYIRIRAHTRAHVLHFETILCAFYTNEAFLSDNQYIYVCRQMKNSPTQELHATVAETQAQLREGGFPV